MILTAIATLALLGGLNAAAAICVFYRENRKPPEQPTGPACTSVFQTRHAHLLGLPNGVVGLAFYLVTIALAIAAAAGAPRLVSEVAAAIALVAAAFSSYLTAVLVFRLRMSCRICYTGNAINVLLAVLWLWAAGWLSPRP